MNPHDTPRMTTPPSTSPGVGPENASVTLVRAEEEVVLAHLAVPRERVRLVKRIVTETVTVTTEVRRGELHIERQRDDERPQPAPWLDRPAGPARNRRTAGGVGRLRDRLSAVGQRIRASAIAPAAVAFDEQVIELSLMEEQVVVTKRVVPRERARLFREIVTADEPIEATLRKQEVALERTSRRRTADAP